MQCNRPLFCTSFQNNPTFPPHHIQTHCPDVIGEGDVMSFTLPDGSLQCFFVPINKRERWTPYYIESSMPNALPISSNNNEAWFVRSIFNTYAATGPNQLSNNHGDPFTRSYFNSPSQSFVQKFHNDNWTSTTDLHCFYPRLRHDLTKSCAAIQVEIPSQEKSIFHYGTICNRICYCNHKIENTQTKTPHNTVSPMSVDDTELKRNYNSKKEENNVGKNKNYTCACRSRSQLDTANKGVTTYADQGITCKDMKCGYTQTCNHRHWEKTDIEVDTKHQRIRKSKKNNAKHSTNSGACSSSCSSSCSDTRQFGNA